MVSRSRIKQLITYYYKSGEVISNITKETIIEHRMRVDGVMYPVRRLIWLYMTGEWYMGNIYTSDSSSRVDWLNLTTTKPSRERRLNANSSSGTKGITYNKKDGRWVVNVYDNGSQRYIGSYKERWDAEQAHLEAGGAPTLVDDDIGLPQSGCEGIDWNEEYIRWFVTDDNGQYIGSSKRLSWCITKRKSLVSFL